MRTWIVAGLAAVSWLASAWPADAQDTARRGRRVYNGLFGPTERDTQRPPVLTYEMSIYTGVDDNSRFATHGLLDSALHGEHPHQGVVASLEFLRRRPRWTFDVGLQSAVRYYPSLQGIGTQAHSIDGALTLAPGRDWRLQLAQSAAYSPTYQLALSPPADFQDESETLLPPVTGLDHAVSRERHFSYASTAGLTRTWRTRGEAGAAYTRRHTAFLDQTDYVADILHLRSSWRLTPAFDLRLGYAGTRAGFSDRTRTLHHDIEAGIGFHREFVFASRTALRLTSGFSVVTTPGGRQTPVTGSVEFTRQMSPRWATRLSALRRLQYVDALQEPVIANMLSGTLSGYVSRRLQVAFAPSYTRGAIAGSQTDYDSWNVDTRLEYAVSRHWAIYVAHVLYRYQFSAVDGLPEFLTSGLNRQGVRVGLALWAPVAR